MSQTSTSVERRSSRRSSRPSTRASTRASSLSSLRKTLKHMRSYSPASTRSDSCHSTNRSVHELPFETELASLPCIFASSNSIGDSTNPDVSLGWYSWWISQQISSMPANVLSVFQSTSREETAQTFIGIWIALASFLSSNPGTSIDDTIRHLVAHDWIPNQTDEDSLRTYRTFIFTLLGWQTMLFRSDCGSCPPSQFAIADELDGYRGHSHMKLIQSQTYSREPLDRLLLQFGVLLPPKNYDLSQLPEHKQAFVSIRDVDTSTLHASLLVRVGHFEIIWTDCLACHLELDLSNNRIYLFRYPSFCVASMATRTSGAPEKATSSPIYSCAQRASGAAKWAKTDDISDFLEEVVMSYRLLFGQNKQSRKLFRELSPFQGLPAIAQDKLLWQLCGRKTCDVPTTRVERERWDLKLDFPVLRSRLAILAYEMSLRKPRTWSQLWRDKRDSAQWATFWTVLIFGVISICLSAVQVILAAVQLAST